MQITVKMTGDKQIQQSLTKLGPAIDGTTKKNIKQALNSTVDELKVYPPPPQGSKYKRTFHYRKSWAIQENKGRSFTLTSDTVRAGAKKQYSQYVGGWSDGTGQAMIHQGRWPIISNVVTKWMGTLMKSLDEMVKKIIKQEGL
jgi:hypothetical protein